MRVPGQPPAPCPHRPPPPPLLQPPAMQAALEGRLVRIEQPKLLEHIFLLTGDINT